MTDTSGLEAASVLPRASSRGAARHRNQNLDVLRRIPILLVLGRHFDVFPLWTRIGWAGVDLFFVLSGFLISGLLFTEKLRFGTIRIRRLYVRRALKIYAPFYAYLTVTFALLRAAHQPESAFFLRRFPCLYFAQNYISYKHPELWGH